MLRKLLSSLILQTDYTALYRDIIRREAKIGGSLFGPVPPRGRREFFCLDEHTWFWHEEWVDDKGQHHTVSTRYDIRPNGVLKAQDNQPYQYIGLDEAKRLYKVVALYNKKIDAEMYNAA
jgi:hypothetical protein